MYISLWEIKEMENPKRGSLELMKNKRYTHYAVVFIASLTTTKTNLL